MPDLNIEVTGVEAAHRGLVPLLQFKLRLTNGPADQRIHAVILQVQIQLQAPQRSYTATEKEKLCDIFGEPHRWGQTLRNRLWTHANTAVGAFSGTAEAMLAVPASFDLNLLSAKYFYALEEGDVPLLFLFSGSIFYADSSEKFQVAPIPWHCESVYRMPIQKWKETMETHFPKSAWVYMQRDVFDRLYAYKRQQGLATWEEMFERLLEREGVAV